MPGMKPILLLVSMVAVMAMACSADSGSGASDGPPTASPPPVEGLDQPSADLLDPVVADAAERAGVDVAEVLFVSSTEVEWSDGSLGCPKPGMAYTQALVSGFQMIVRAGGRDLDYRVRGPGDFRLCDRT